MPPPRRRPCRCSRRLRSTGGTAFARLSDMSDPIASISTMWSQGRFKHPEREHDHMPSFAQTVSRLGFSHVEINYVIPRRASTT